MLSKIIEEVKSMKEIERLAKQFNITTNIIVNSAFQYAYKNDFRNQEEVLKAFLKGELEEVKEYVDDQISKVFNKIIKKAMMKYDIEEIKEAFSIFKEKYEDNYNEFGQYVIGKLEKYIGSLR